MTRDYRGEQVMPSTESDGYAELDCLRITNIISASDLPTTPCRNHSD